MNSPLHLSEDDLDQVLLGAGSASSAAHLATCEPCALRLSAFESQLAIFNHASFAWSEARSNTISRDLLAHKPAPRLTLTGVATSAAAMLLAIALGLQHHTQNFASQSTEAVTHPAHQADQIASDNAMLAAIDSEMSSTQQFELDQDSDSTSRQAAD